MTPTDKFVEAMRDLWDMRQPDSATWEHMQKDIRQAGEAFADAVCPDEQDHCEGCECDESYHNNDFPHVPGGNTHERLCVDPLLKRVME